MSHPVYQNMGTGTAAEVAHVAELLRIHLHNVEAIKERLAPFDPRMAPLALKQQLAAEQQCIDELLGWLRGWGVVS